MKKRQERTIISSNKIVITGAVPVEDVSELVPAVYTGRLNRAVTQLDRARHTRAAACR